MDIPSFNIGKILGTSDKALTTESADATVAPMTRQTATTVDRDVEVAAPVVEEKATTVEKEVAPAVEHEKVTEEHEQKEQVVVDKERHQDHYHTTVQPAKDREVLPEQHQYEDTETQVKHVEHDDGAVQAKADGRNANFESTSTEGGTVEKLTKEPTAVANEEVHHHLHETIQPVIEKETIQPTVTHKTIHVKEVHHDAAVDQGVTTEPAVPVKELKEKLDKQ